MYDKMKTNFVEINNIYNRINEIIKNHNEIIKNYNKINNKINNTEKFKKVADLKLEILVNSKEENFKKLTNLKERLIRVRIYWNGLSFDGSDSEAAKAKAAVDKASAALATAAKKGEDLTALKAVLTDAKVKFAREAVTAWGFIKNTKSLYKEIEQAYETAKKWYKDGMDAAELKRAVRGSGIEKKRAEDLRKEDKRKFKKETLKWYFLKSINYNNDIKTSNSELAAQKIARKSYDFLENYPSFQTIASFGLKKQPKKQPNKNKEDKEIRDKNKSAHKFIRSTNKLYELIVHQKIEETVPTDPDNLYKDPSRRTIDAYSANNYLCKELNKQITPVIDPEDAVDGAAVKPAGGRRREGPRGRRRGPRGWPRPRRH